MIAGDCREQVIAVLIGFFLFFGPDGEQRTGLERLHDGWRFGIGVEIGAFYDGLDGPPGTALPNGIAQ